VAYLIVDEKLFERAFKNLEKIKDNYKKMVLFLDDVLVDYKGIIHQDVRDFLA
jgi:hypothetical protein